MDQIWNEMYEAAKAVLNARRVSEYVTCGEVAAAVRSKSGRIYTGICIDTCSTLGICAERSAIFAMLTAGEQEIDRVLAILPDGSSGAPWDSAAATRRRVSSPPDRPSCRSGARKAEASPGSASPSASRPRTASARGQKGKTKKTPGETT